MRSASRPTPNTLSAATSAAAAPTTQTIGFVTPIFCVPPALTRQTANGRKPSGARISVNCMRMSAK